MSFPVTKREFLRLLELWAQRMEREGKNEVAKEFDRLFDLLSKNTVDTLIKREGGGSISEWLEGRGG